ncbi:LamG-like jellyroll fold domain-containing protein [Rubritalea tangerina]|uniref:LamG-like jellyroll fold domain-containing protein n=1 Tax=Rubritalea tangerina TaxID=430798 RepID=A0ABW4ZEC7_9BACT
MKSSELHQAIQDLLDGCISTSTLEQLEQELLNNPEALKTYLAHSDLDTLLQVDHEINQQRTASAVPIESIMQRQKRRQFKIATLAAAATILLTLIVLNLFFPTPPRAELSLRATPGSHFTLTHSDSHPEDPSQPNKMSAGSQLTLTQGSVELTFDSGVRSIISAPADLTLHDHQTLHLHQGKAWFHVPPRAKGFTLTTTELQVIDLGTEFAVLSSPDQYDEVHVFKGSILAKSLRSSSQPEIPLLADQAVRITTLGTFTPIKNSMAHFNAELPTTLPYLHWNMDTLHDLSPTASQLPLPSAAPSPNKLDSVPGRFGRAIHSHGQGGTLNTHWPGFSGSSPRSVAFWIKIPTTTPQAHTANVLGWGDRHADHRAPLNAPSTASFYHFLSRSDNQLRIGLSTGRAWVTGSTNLADGQWHHITGIYTGKNRTDGWPELLLYVDASPEPTTYHKRYDTSVPQAAPKNINTLTRNDTAVPLMLFSELWNTTEPGNQAVLSIDELFVIDGIIPPKTMRSLIKHNQLSPPHSTSPHSASPSAAD